MSTAVWFIMALAIIAVAYVIIAPSRSTRGAITDQSAPGLGSGRSREIESAEAYRNHLAMARWIELQLKDDLVRSSVPEDEQSRARRLLEEFYGDER